MQAKKTNTGEKESCKTDQYKGNTPNLQREPLAEQLIKDTVLDRDQLTDHYFQKTRGPFTTYEHQFLRGTFSLLLLLF